MKWTPILLRTQTLLLVLLVLPGRLAAQLPKGSQQVRVVELDPTLGLSPRAYAEGKGELKKFDLSVDGSSPLTALPQFVDREMPVLETNCFYPDLKLVYRDYTYVVSTHCASIYKFRNLKPWETSRYPLADDFIYTESLVRYFHTLRDSLFGNRFDAFYERLADSEPSAYAQHLQKQTSPAPERELPSVEIATDKPKPNEAKPQETPTVEPKPVSVAQPAPAEPTSASPVSEAAPVKPERSRPTDIRDMPAPPQRRGSVPKVIHTPTSGSDLPAYMKAKPVEQKPSDDLLDKVAKDLEFDLKLDDAPKPAQTSPAVTSSPKLLDPTTVDARAAEMQAPPQPTPAPAPAPATVPEPAPAPAPRPESQLKETLAPHWASLQAPRVSLPLRPVITPDQFAPIIVTQPEIMLEPDPVPETAALNPAPKPEAKPAAPAPKPTPAPVPSPAAKPVPAPAPEAKRMEAEESLDADLEVGEEVHEEAEEEAADEGMDGIDGLEDDDRDGFIDEGDSLDSEMDSLLGDDEEEMDFEEDDGLDVGDF